MWIIVLRKIKSSEEQIEERFYKASRGWIKYKPLFEYITNNGVIYDFRVDITTYSNKLRVNLFETSTNPVKPISHKVYDEKTFVDINNGMYKVLSDIEKIIAKKY